MGVWAILGHRTRVRSVPPGICAIAFAMPCQLVDAEQREYRTAGGVVQKSASVCIMPLLLHGFRLKAAVLSPVCRYELIRPYRGFKASLQGAYAQKQHNLCL